MNHDTGSVTNIIIANTILTYKLQCRHTTVSCKWISEYTEEVESSLQGSWCDFSLLDIVLVLMLFWFQYSSV